MEISSDDEEETIDNYNVSTLKDLGTEFSNVILHYKYSSKSFKLHKITLE